MSTRTPTTRRNWFVKAGAGALLILGAMTAPSQAMSAKDEKVIRIPMTTAGPGDLDPVKGSTTYENRVCSTFYETLLEYEYLVRPFKLRPLLLEDMPTVEQDGKLWKFKLRDDVFFHDAECFPGGKGRKLVAADVIYSWKRLADPEHTYENWWLVDKLIKGFNEYKESQAKLVADGAKFDYDASVEGMRVINDLEFEIELNEANQQFAWRLAMFQFSIVPREAVEQFESEFTRRPVGTGPFIVRDKKDWDFGSGLTVYRNPNYRQAFYPTEHMPEDVEAGLTEAAGQQIPFVDKIEFGFYVEAQPMWLKFKENTLDYTTVPQAGFEEAISRRTKKLKRDWRAKRIRMDKVPLLDFIFRSFNMEDDRLGGYTEDRKALRRAFNLAMDWDEMNEALYFGMALAYDGPIPPGLDGHPENEEHRVSNSTRGPNFDKARDELRKAGYEIGPDGRAIDFEPVRFYTSQGAESERIVSLLQRNFDTVGIKINPVFVDFPKLMQVTNNKQAPMFSFAWGSDYPDAENNLQLYYGPYESPGSNHSNYKNETYDRMYEELRTMPIGPERTKHIETMRDMLIEDAPFCGSLARTRVYLTHPWVKNFKPTETFYTYFKYLDVDMDHPDRGE